jgi:hypothetical protein
MLEGPLPNSFDAYPLFETHWIFDGSSRDYNFILRQNPRAVSPSSLQSCRNRHFFTARNSKSGSCLHAKNPKSPLPELEF